MWSKSYTQRVSGIDAQILWQVWADVDQWPVWQNDVESAQLEGEAGFVEGNWILFRPKGGPNLRIQILEIKEGRRFVDLTYFPGAKMIGAHDITVVSDDEVELTVTMSISGPLSFIWRKIVAEGIVRDLPQQTQALIERSRKIIDE